MGGWRQGWLQEIRQISGKCNCRFISLRTCLDPCHEPLHRPHTFTWDAGKGGQSTHDRQSAVIITRQWVSCTFWMWIMWGGGVDVQPGNIIEVSICWHTLLGRLQQLHNWFQYNLRHFYWQKQLTAGHFLNRSTLLHCSLSILPYKGKVQ